MQSVDVPEQYHEILHHCQSEENSNSVFEENFGNFDSPQPTLPTVSNHKNPDINTITAQTLANLIANNNNGNPFLIVDCRYGYEYEGGHIEGAINIRSPEVLERLFFTNRALLYHPDYLHSIKYNFTNVINKLEDLHYLKEHIPENAPAPLIIFHCEFFSEERPKSSPCVKKFGSRN